MPFKEYKKIKRLGHEETDGILEGKVYVQEKVDGANTQIWVEDGKLMCGSRTRVLSEGFNGFYDYVMAHEGIKKCLEEHPTYRLYGEWLVRHTVAYKETVYKQFYLFDVFTEDGEETVRCTTEQVNNIAAHYGILTPKLFGEFENATAEELEKLVGQSDLGPEGEGVVVKNPTFINKFGDWQYAKIVSKKFMEDNAVVFGGNNKFSNVYSEMYIVNKYMTLERVKKIMAKLQPLIDRRLDREHTARVIQTAYHDMFMEEIWEISKKFQTINFKDLSRLSIKKAARIYHDVLDGHEDRVTYAEEEPKPEDV